MILFFFFIFIFNAASSTMLLALIVRNCLSVYCGIVHSWQRIFEIQWYSHWRNSHAENFWDRPNPSTFVGVVHNLRSSSLLEQSQFPVEHLADRQRLSLAKIYFLAMCEIGRETSRNNEQLRHGLQRLKY